MTENMDSLQFSTVTRVTGGDEQTALSVTTENGKGRAAVSSLELGGSFTVSKLAVSSASPTQITASSNRRSITIQNLGPGNLFIKHESASVVDGLVVYPRGSFTVKLASGASIFIQSSSTSDTRVLEVVE